MPEVKTAYRFDEKGYYIGTDPVLEDMLPPDDTMTAPEAKAGCWARWNGETWEYERIPTTAEELEGVEVAHDDRSPHAEEVRALMRTLATGTDDPGNLYLRQDPSTNSLSVVRAPALTEEEDLARREARVRDLRDNLLRTEVDPINAVRWATMSTEKREEWKAYRQALLDVPQMDGFPWDGDAPWPVKPE